MSKSLPHIHGRAFNSAAVDVGAEQWVFVFEGGITLQVGGPWRVVRDGTVVLGWKDDGQRFGVSASIDGERQLRCLLGGSKVDATSVAKCGDLRVGFGPGLALELFNDSCGYEGWQINGPGTRCVVMQGGGRLVDSGEK